MSKYESGRIGSSEAEFNRIGIKRTEAGKWISALQESGELTLETVRSEDWKKISEICVIASPFEDLKRDLQSPTTQYFSEFWIGPYREHEPSSTLIIRDNETREPIGYLVGSKDTRLFEEKAEAGHFRNLRMQARAGDYGEEDNKLHQVHTLAEREGKKLEGIKNMFSQEIWEEVYDRYPAHLHMNFLPDRQGGGLGKIIMQQFLEGLKEKNVKGIHLGCSGKVSEFYKKMGFEIFKEKELSRPDGGTTSVYIMAKDLQK